MFDKLGALKDLAKSPGMVKDMVQMQRKLASQEVTIEHGDIEVCARGDFQIKHIKMDGEMRNDIKDAVNQALKEVQKKSAEAMMKGG